MVLKENYVRFFISLYYTKCDPNMACPLSMDGNISVKPKSKILLFELRWKWLCWRLSQYSDCM